MLHFEKVDYVPSTVLMRNYGSSLINPINWSVWFRTLIWCTLVLCSYIIDNNVLALKYFDSLYIIPLVYGVFFGLPVWADLGLIAGCITIDIFIQSEGLLQSSDFVVLLASLMTLGICSLLSRLLIRKVKRERSLLIERDHLNEQLVAVFAKTIEYKDEYTMGHSVRVADYAVKVATQLGLRPVEVKRIYVAGILHDIGKIGVEDYILKKPGALSQDEWERVQEHVNLGVHILQGIGGFSDVTDMIADHHERWDGKGYPLAKTAEEISLGGRILAIADAYDAMITLRSYRAPFSSVEAQQELRRCSNAQFDPNVVAAFFNMLNHNIKDENSLHSTSR